MKLNIKYYGMLAEAAGRETEAIEVSGGKISDLLDVIFTRHAALEEMSFQVAQDAKIVNRTAVLTTAEIALLPPFAGG